MEDVLYIVGVVSFSILCLSLSFLAIVCGIVYSSGYHKYAQELDKEIVKYFLNSADTMDHTKKKEK